MTTKQINAAKKLLENYADRMEVSFYGHGSACLTVYWLEGGQKIFYAFDCVEDWAQALDEAQAKANELNSKYQLDGASAVRARHLAPLPAPETRNLNMIHDTPSPFAGRLMRIKPNVQTIGGSEFHVEDWWDRVAGRSWMVCDGNPACLKFAMRSAFADLPTDNEVLYGKVGPFGHLLHISELEPMDI